MKYSNFIIICLLLVCNVTKGQTAIFWSNETNDSISRSEIDGSNVDESFIIDASPSTGIPRGIYTSDTYIYWSTWNGGTIGRSNLDGTSVNNSFISTTNTTVGYIHSDGVYLYWTNNSGSSSIGRSLLDGTEVNENYITLPGSSYIGIYTHGDYIYFSNAITGNIGRVEKSGANANTSFITGGDNPRGLYVDDEYIFWADGGGANSIGRASLNGSNVNADYISGVTPGDITSDGTYLYWTEENDNTIARSLYDGTAVNRSFISGIDKPYGITVGNLSTVPEPETIGILIGVISILAVFTQRHISSNFKS